MKNRLFRVFVIADTGYLCYTLKHQADGVLLTLEKLAQASLTCQLVNQEYTLHKRESLLIPISMHQGPLHPVEEQLSLGSHKKQDWELVKRRLDMTEIFPMWGCVWDNRCPQFLKLLHSQGAFYKILNECTESIHEHCKLEILPAFTRLFLAGFHGILVPRLYDTDFQGLLPYQEPKDSDPSPLALLTESAALIRSLFFREEKNSITLLSCLPPDFHCGRMTQVRTCAGDMLDCEWSKKQLRRVVLAVHSERELLFRFPKDLTQCRVRQSPKDRGKKHVLLDGELTLKLSPHSRLYLDRFKK